MNSPLWSSPRKHSVEALPGVGRETSGSCSSPQAAVILLSPPPPKRRLSSGSGSQSIHGLDTGGLTINELVDYIRNKGQHGLIKEYKLLKEEDAGGTFEASRCVITFVCEICHAISFW